MAEHDLNNEPEETENFNSDEEPEELLSEPKKKRGRLDRWIMGILIGSAVGSVIGMALAPKSGKETRKLIKEKGREWYQKGQDLSSKIKKTALEHPPQPKGMKQIPSEDMGIPLHSMPEQTSSEKPLNEG